MPIRRLSFSAVFFPSFGLLRSAAQITRLIHLFQIILCCIPALFKTSVKNCQIKKNVKNLLIYLNCIIRRFQLGISLGKEQKKLKGRKR